jgi:hypothetical protein
MPDGTVNIEPEAQAVEAPAVAPKRSKRAARKAKAKKAAREQSTIAFPYMDLEAAISVARAIMGAGGIPLTREQLAGVMNLAAGSGNFVLKVATARVFGIVANVGGKYGLTDLGSAIVDSDDRRQRAARAEAFLNVPLYKKTYDEFKGRQLPPRPHGLEQAFIRFGVTPKQKDNARWAFDKSASQAGFFAAGNDRLIEPIIGVVARVERPATEAAVDDDMRYPAPPPAGPDVTGLHPFIQGLIEKLPEPETTWTIEGRQKWLKAAADIFDLMYKGDGAIEIRVQTPQNSHSE